MIAGLMGAIQEGGIKKIPKAKGLIHTSLGCQAQGWFAAILR